MLGGTRNGRALKLALLVGLVLLTLYFLVSWKREAQTLSTNLALAEQEYETIVKRYNKLEKELTDSVLRESRSDKELRHLRDREAEVRQQKLDFEAKCKQTVESKTAQIEVLEEEKTELTEQLEAVKADRDSKAQDVQRLNEELRDAKDHAEDEYQALSASCVQKQQTCDKRAKEADSTISNLRIESATNRQSLVDCEAKLSVEQDSATSCNTRLTSLEKEGANRLNEIEQIQSQLYQAQQDNALLVAELHEGQKSDEAQPKAGQVREEDRHGFQHNVRRRYNVEDAAGGEKIKRDVDHGEEFGQRNQVPGVGDDVINQRWQLPGGHDIGVRRGEGDSLEAKNDLRNPGRGHQNDDFGDLNHANVGLNDKVELPMGGADRREEVGLRKTGDGRERFSDIKLTDEQKWNVFESLQGKLSRGERLDDRQQRIYDILLKDFGHAAKPAAVKNVQVRNGMGVDENYRRDEGPDDDGVKMGGKKEDQLPNPLDAREEEVKDLVEEAQKPGEFDNLGGGGQVEGGEDQEEQVGGAGEDLERGQGGVDDEDENYLHEDEEEEEGGKKVGEKVDDNPLPRPGQEENPDDEDVANGNKADNNEEEENQEDVYGDEMYKQDKQQFRQERLQKNFDRQL